MRLLRLSAVCLAAGALIIALPMLASAQTQTEGCGWEDGTSTILGFFGTNLVDVANTASPDPVHTGLRSLTLAEGPHTGTPQAYIAYIEGLQNGDQVTASFWAYDVTPDVSPSLRIWGHWGTDGDVGSYVASASGPSGYSTGIGWEKIEFTWTLDTGAVPAATALIVECRLYSTPATDPLGYTQYFIDDVEVTAPATASITLPCAQGTPVEATTWGTIKTLY